MGKYLVLAFTSHTKKYLLANMGIITFWIISSTSPALTASGLMMAKVTCLGISTTGINKVKRVRVSVDPLKHL